MNTFPIWVSSTGQGIAQRIVSLVMLIIPVLSVFGFDIKFQQADIEMVVNAACILVFAIWHAWAWMRAWKMKSVGAGKYAQK